VGVVEAIELLHAQDINLANPCATRVVRDRLIKVLEPHGPRSWSRAEHEVFAMLSVQAQEIIERHAKLDSDAVRRAQNECAELRQRLLKSVSQKEIEK
jgi:hypothetical protein